MLHNEVEVEIDSGWILGRIRAMRPAVRYLMRVCSCVENSSMCLCGCRPSQTAKKNAGVEEGAQFSADWKRATSFELRWTAWTHASVVRVFRVFCAVAEKIPRPKLCQHADCDGGRGNIYICLYQRACASNARLGCQSLSNAFHLDGAQQQLFEHCMFAQWLNLVIHMNLSFSGTCQNGY